MSYDIHRPLQKSAGGGIDGSLTSIWTYLSNDDAATVAADGYFTNGYDLGLNPFDVIYSIQQSASIMSIFRCVSVTPLLTRVTPLSTGGVGVPVGSSRSVTASSDTMTPADYNGIIKWKFVSGGTQSIIAGTTARQRVTIVDAVGSSAIALDGIGCTINLESVFPGITGPFGTVTIEWDDEASNWMVVA